MRPPVLVRIITRNYSQGKWMHCRSRDTTSGWTLDWKIFWKAIYEPWKDAGSAGCACHTPSRRSSRPSHLLHLLYSIFPENSATQGASWQTGHPPAVRMQQQEQETEIVLWVRALINCRACLWSLGGSRRALQQPQTLASQVLPQPVALQAAQCRSCYPLCPDTGR